MRLFGAHRQGFIPTIQKDIYFGADSVDLNEIVENTTQLDTTGCPHHGRSYNTLYTYNTHQVSISRCLNYSRLRSKVLWFSVTHAKFRKYIYIIIYLGIGMGIYNIFVYNTQQVRWCSQNMMAFLFQYTAPLSTSKIFTVISSECQCDRCSSGPWDILGKM